MDTAHRHYVVSALDASASLVNDAVEALQAAHTKPGNLNVGRFYGSNVTSTYGRIKAIWKDVVTAVGDLDFDLATTYSTPLIALSRRFHALALEVSDVVIYEKCLGSGADEYYSVDSDGIAGGGGAVPKAAAQTDMDAVLRQEVGSLGFVCW